MRLRQQRLIAVALTSLLTVLTITSCTARRTATPPRVVIPPTTTTSSAPMTTTTTTVDPNVRTLNMARVLIALNESTSTTRPARHPAPRDIPTKSFSGDVTLPTAGDYHDWPDWRLWHAVGLCEQRGDTSDGIAWHGSSAGGLPGSGYPGGLGMSRDFWRQFTPIAGVATTNGADASPGEQIRVARAGSHNGSRMGGWSSWRSGCITRTMATL